METKGAVISLNNLDAGFGRGKKLQTIIRDINGSVCRGELVSLIGANGSGKSTILRTIIGLLPSLSGRIELFGRETAEYNRIEMARTIGYVAAGSPASYNMRVEELVTLGRFPHTNWIGRLQKNDRDLINESIESVGIAHLRERNIYQLSDGEKQRAMIARALAQDTALLLLDEPTAFLDLPNKFDLIHLLKQLSLEREKAIVISTHDLNIAVRESDKIWLLHHSHLFEGAPEDLLLNGEFASLFGDSRLKFAEEEGAFSYSSESLFDLELDAAPELKSLTRLALIRMGAKISEGATDHKVVAFMDGENPSWYYTGLFGERKFTSFYEMGSFFKKHCFK